MRHYKIYQAAEKVFPENFDIEHYLSILFQHPQNTWFAPNNSNNDAFTVCEQLLARHLIAMRKIPIWVNGSFRGVKTECLYNMDMEYRNLSELPNNNLLQPEKVNYGYREQTLF